MPKGKYYQMKQGNGINELVAIGKTPTRELAPTDAWDDDIKTVCEFGEFRLYQGKGLVLTQRAVKLLCALFIKTAENKAKNDLTITLPISEYLQMLGFKDTKNNRKRTRIHAKEDLRRLYAASVDTYRTRSGNRELIQAMRIIGQYGDDLKDALTVTFTPGFYALYRDTYRVMNLPTAAIRLDIRYNPHSLPLAYKLSTHKKQNYTKANANIISVAALLSACPDMPKYEDVSKSGSRDITRRIIEPFERDITALNDCISWQYWQDGQAAATPHYYTEFIGLNIKVEWIDYPKLTFKKSDLSDT